MSDKSNPTETSLEVVTFGCRLNTYESQVMKREAKKAGLDRLDGGAVLVNTCAVTGEAVRQARQAIRRPPIRNPPKRTRPKPRIQSLCPAVRQFLIPDL